MDTKELELILEGKSSKSTSGQVWTIFKCLSIFTWAIVPEFYYKMDNKKSRFSLAS